MKILKLALLLAVAPSINGCATCVGRITPNSPPFFSDEFYKPGVDSMDEVFKEVMEAQQDTTLTTTSNPDKEAE